MKKVWMSMLSKSEEIAQTVMGKVKSYGLDPAGHFWSDNIEKSEWMGPRNEMLDKNVALWLIVATKDDLEAADIRYGLSLLSICVQAQRGHGFPTIILHGDSDYLSVDDLPTPLKHAEIMPASSQSLGAKMVARANTPFKPPAADYRMDVYGLAGLGTWLEVGPASGQWKGVMCGVSGEGADIGAHGVGKAGEMPKDKMVINYAQKGLKINLGEKEYTAWAVQNELDDKTSYFVKVTGTPDSLLFGELSQEEEAEVFVVKLT